MLTLVLVSQSPERRKILVEEGLLFHTSSVSVSENLNENINLDEAIKAIARQKLEAFLEQKALKELEGGLKDKLLLSADTLVCVGNKTLAKPKDKKEAYSHMKTLSNTRHAVKTALCFYEEKYKNFFTDLETTFITFKPLTEEEIEGFLETKDYEGKAGGYSILGPASRFILKKEGSFSNVRGFPLELFEKMVACHGWNLRRKS